MDILFIYGSEDEYLELSDIDEEFPIENSKHITKEVISGANHSFEQHTKELIRILNDFISRNEHYVDDK